jgi:hypothetical protein
MFQYPDDLHENLFMKIPRRYFEEGYWAELPTSSQAIYPVILKYSNAQGTCFPSELTISKIAGTTEKTVREGLKGLVGFPGFEKEKYMTKKGHTAYRYIFEPVAKGVESISISHAFFNGLNWSELTPSAKAIYPVLKCFSWWDNDLYVDNEGITYKTDDDDSSVNPYFDREYDFISPDKENVAKFSGINIRSIGSAYESIHDSFFTERHESVEGRKTWKLYVQPPCVLNQGCLDIKLKKYLLL